MSALLVVDENDEEKKDDNSEYDDIKKKDINISPVKASTERSKRLRRASMAIQQR